MKTIIVYDDTGKKSEVIEDIIGERGFADVVVKRRRLEDYYRHSVSKLDVDVEWKKMGSVFEYSRLIQEVDVYSEEEIRVLHCFSNYIISDEEKVILSLNKILYIDEPYRVMDGKKIAAMMFPDVKSYILFCKNVISGQNILEQAKNIREYFEVEGMVDVSVIGNFIQCITGNFDSRYFNVLEGNEYTLVKSSVNKVKIKSEYTFYHLLPEDMKFWFVMPFNYYEDEKKASYTMERLHMTDVAVKWVHGSIEENEFEEMLDKYFFFFRNRHSKMCSEKEYSNIARRLYLDKVLERVEELKSMEEYQKIEKMLEVCGENIDKLVSKYIVLKEKIESGNNYPCECVIGHGDLCFANTMYNKSTKTLKFIDPKGALSEEELWTNPYYDVAKLSHSVCGRYDFFNNALFDIGIGEDFSYHLDIPFNNKKYINIFKKKISENGFDYLTVRIYEASLFLSMLPLHIDNPHKVFGFILNVKNILEEIEKDV